MGVGLKKLKSKIEQKNTESIPKRAETEKIETEHEKLNWIEVVRFQFQFWLKKTEPHQKNLKLTKTTSFWGKCISNYFYLILREIFFSSERNVPFISIKDPLFFTYFSMWDASKHSQNFILNLNRRLHKW